MTTRRSHNTCPVMDPISAHTLHCTSCSPKTTTESTPKHVLNSQKKKMITLLLLGETGTGKTSFMSMLATMLQDAGPFELEEIHDKKLETYVSGGQSRTTKSKMYSIGSWDGTNIRIIDTPGLADSRGVDQDERHKTEINRAIKQHATSIDGVLVFLNGNVERLSTATAYTLSIISSMFPRSMTDNVGFMFTNSDPWKWNFDLDTLPTELRKSSYWQIDNPLSRLQKIEQIKGERTVSSMYQQQLQSRLQAIYDETIPTMNHFLHWLDQIPSQPTKVHESLCQQVKSAESKHNIALASRARLHQEREMYRQITADLEANDREKSVVEAQVAVESTPPREAASLDYPSTICMAFESLSSPSLPPSTICHICHRTVESHTSYSPKPQKPREIAPETKRRQEAVRSDAESLESAKMTSERKQAEIEEGIRSICDDLFGMVGAYNQNSLSGSFASHMSAAIKLLKTRRDDLKRRSNGAREAEVLERAIASYELGASLFDVAKKYGTRKAAEEWMNM